MLSVPVGEEILEAERNEAVRIAEHHIQRVLSGKITTHISGRQLSPSEQLQWEADFLKRNLPTGSGRETFICLRCGECCYYSYLDGIKKLRPECEKYCFVPRKVENNRFLPASCKIHNDPVIVPGQVSLDPCSLPEKFDIIIKGRRYRNFSEKRGISFFGKDPWETIRLRNSLCVFSCPGSQFGPCREGVRTWEEEKKHHPHIPLPEGVNEQLAIVQFFRKKVDELLKTHLR